jgi:hypothetical protein
MESKLLFSCNSRSRKDFMGVVFWVVTFTLWYSIISSKLKINAWWIFILMLLFISFNLIYLTNKQIEIYSNKDVIIRNLFKRWCKSLNSNQLYFYVVDGGAKSIYNQVIVIRQKRTDKLIFRIPLDSEQDYIKMTEILSVKLEMKRVKSYANISNIR